MDITYFEYGYIDEKYFATIARAESAMIAFDLATCAIRAIHLMQQLTYRIKEETRLFQIREETRLKRIAEETRLYAIKKG